MKKITRRSFLAAAGVSAAALALTACGGSSNSTTSTAASSAAASTTAGDAAAAASDPKVTLVYAEVNPLDTIVGQTATHFKEKVEELTGRLPAFWALRTTFWTLSSAAPPPSTSAVSPLSH